MNDAAEEKQMSRDVEGVKRMHFCFFGSRLFFGFGEHINAGEAVFRNAFHLLRYNGDETVRRL